MAFMCEYVGQNMHNHHLSASACAYNLARNPRKKLLRTNRHHTLHTILPILKPRLKYQYILLSPNLKEAYPVLCMYPCGTHSSTSTAGRRLKAEALDDQCFCFGRHIGKVTPIIIRLHQRNRFLQEQSILDRLCLISTTQALLTIHQQLVTQEE